MIKQQQNQQQVPLISRTKSKSYFYPSAKKKELIGKDSFIPRFPKQLTSQSKCSKFCKWLSYSLTHKRLIQQLLPITKPTFETSPQKITYTWIGHSTAVISIGNSVNILIDPVFSQRCSPFQWIGPKRYRAPACNINQLPEIHAVLISHDHYDHLDQQALRDLQNKFKPIFFAGLQSRDVFPKRSNLFEMDWSQSKKVAINGFNFQISFVPVCHWSKRKFFQRNTRLWGGFVIKTPKGHKIFYSGDTAYCEIFRQIGELFGPFQLSILPIGAYEPRHILSEFHINPEESVIIHKQINSKKSVGVHWGTFPLGFEHYMSPKIDLEQAKDKYSLSSQEFIVIGHGQSISISYL